MPVNYKLTIRFRIEEPHHSARNDFEIFTDNFVLGFGAQAGSTVPENSMFVYRLGEASQLVGHFVQPLATGEWHLLEFISRGPLKPGIISLHSGNFTVPRKSVDWVRFETAPAGNNTVELRLWRDGEDRPVNPQVFEAGETSSCKIIAFEFDTDGELPSARDDVVYFSSTMVAEECIYSVSNGQLHQTSLKKPGNHSYHHPSIQSTDGQVDPTKSLLIEARIKIDEISSDDSGIGGHGVAIQCSDGKNEYGVYFTKEGLNLRVEGDDQLSSTLILTTAISMSTKFIHRPIQNANTSSLTVNYGFRVTHRTENSTHSLSETGSRLRATGPMRRGTICE